MLIGSRVTIAVLLYTCNSGGAFQHGDLVGGRDGN